MVEDEEHVTIRHLDLRKEVGLSMVFANDDLVVFPPINHENLYERDRESSSTPSSPSRLSDSSSVSSLSPFDSDGRYEFDRKSQSPPSESGEKSRWTFLNYYSTLETSIVQRWWKLLLARVLSKFQNIVTCFSRSGLCSSTLRSFYPVIIIVILWWMRNRARRRGETVAHLRDTIKERDKRITQLLHQVAQMNDLFIEKKHSN